MLRIVLPTVLTVLLVAPALGDDTPAGWTKSAGGSYTHTATGLECPADLAGYALKSVTAPADPGFEGVCTYDNGKGELGLLRLRRYIADVGETPVAISNDEGLMHPNATPDKGVPVEAYRGGPGPVVDGTPTYQFVVTRVFKGLLVDCIARHNDASKPPLDFPLACLKLSGG